MVRYLSPAWLDRLGAPLPRRGSPGGGAGADGVVVLRQLVVGGPDGTEVGYDIVVSAGPTELRRRAGEPADVTFTTDFETAAAIASGSLSANAALAAGRVKVSGDVSVVGTLADRLAGADPMPPDLRAETEFA